jgi:hypothetical protein
LAFTPTPRVHFFSLLLQHIFSTTRRPLYFNTLLLSSVLLPSHPEVSVFRRFSSSHFFPHFLCTRSLPYLFSLLAFLFTRLPTFPVFLHLYFPMPCASCHVPCASSFLRPAPPARVAQFSSCLFSHSLFLHFCSTPRRALLLLTFSFFALFTLALPSYVGSDELPATCFRPASPLGDRGADWVSSSPVALSLLHFTS